MITSMTGFGRGVAECEGARVRVELRSVNSRFCDIQVRSSNSLQEFDGVARERLQGALTRGKITAQVEWEEEGESGPLPVLDEAVARGYLQQLERLQELAGLEKRPDWSAMLRLPGLFRMETRALETEVVERLVGEAVDRALEDFGQMRETEGETLARDLRQRVEGIETRLQRIESMVGEGREKVRERLREKVEGLLQPGTVDEDRLAMEVVMIAERSDITEEIVRFHSHNAQFIETLDKGGEVGRRLNFLLQEMNREANTTNSKSTDPQIVHLAVEIKEEVERLREQVQNLA
ncbi:MAG: YicC family protein [Gemmatimonadetes bacterium]|jgi:uncharacterized protein (TIGR00255 family)|nr:YicC family protein [Gemmatimonadota bacterium]